MYSYIGKSVLNDHLGSNTDPCYIQNHVITNRVIKRLRCIFTLKLKMPLNSLDTMANSIDPYQTAPLQFASPSLYYENGHTTVSLHLRDLFGPGTEPVYKCFILYITIVL